MRINFLVGLILPWLGGLFLIKKDKVLFSRLYLFATGVATVINLWGNCNNFWILKPKLRKRQYLTTTPFNFGLYPIMGILMNFFIKHSNKAASIWIIFFSIFTTAFEFSFKLLGRVIYGNSWNLAKTFMSYFFSYSLTYQYYLWLSKRDSLKLVGK